MGSYKFAVYEPLRTPLAVDGSVIMPSAALSCRTVSVDRPSEEEIIRIEKEIYNQIKALKMEGFNPESIVMSYWLYVKFIAHYRGDFQSFDLKVIPVPSEDLYFSVVPDKVFDYFLRQWSPNA
jgi:hypothetical protein